MPTKADEIFREFNRYTGDGKVGEPIAAPLPIGDPSSGLKSLRKSEIRDWGNDLEAGVDSALNAPPYGDFSGKTIVTIGDSITQGSDAYNWQPRLAELTGATVINGGFPGSRMSDFRLLPDWNSLTMYKIASYIASGDFSEGIAAAGRVATGESKPSFNTAMAALAAQDWASVDTIMVLFGTNDFTAGRMIGADTDGDGTTFKGAINTTITTIQAAYPHINLVFATPLWRARVMSLSAGFSDPIDDSNVATNGNGVLLSAYCDALKERCSAYQVPVLDLQATFGINKSNWAAYMPDGLHLQTALGNERMARRIAAGLAAPAGANAERTDFPLDRSTAVDYFAAGWVPTAGVTYHFDGLSYLGKTGATDIADLRGLIPAGNWSLAHWGVTGTGDETAKVQAAFNATSNRTLLGVPNLFVSYTALTVPAQGIEFIPNGTIFSRVANGSSSGFSIMGDFVGRNMAFTAPGGTANRNVWVRGDDVDIRGLSVIHMVESGPNIAAVGVTVQKSPAAKVYNVQLANVSTVDVSSPVVSINTDGFVLDTARFESYRTAVYLIDAVSPRLRNGHSFGLGLASNGSPGENSILIEATAPDATTNVRIDDWLSEDSGEHGYRLGGQQRISDVIYSKCVAKRSGSSILGGDLSGGEWHGGCGFKALGGTTVGGTRHERLTYTDCAVLDVNQTSGAYPAGHGVNNYTPFLIVACDDVAINNPMVGVEAETYSCRSAILFTAVDGLHINGGNVRACSVSAIRPYRETPIVGYPGQNEPIKNVTIDGGFFEVSSPSGGAVLYYGENTDVENDGLVVNGAVFSGGARAARFETPAVGGSFKNVLLDYAYQNPNIASGVATFPIQDGDGLLNAMSNIVGPYRESPAYGATAANGSTFQDTLGKRLADRIGANWQWRTFCVSAGYDPVGTVNANLDSITPSYTYFSRVGDVVTMFGRIDFDPTATGAFSGDITLPVASAFTVTRHAGGTFDSGDGAMRGLIWAEAPNKLRFVGTSTVTSSRGCWFNLSYRVLP